MSCRRWNSKPVCRSRRFLPGFRGSCRQPLINIPRKAVYPGHRSECRTSCLERGLVEMSILWTIIIGFIAGVIAKFIMPGDNEPSGFILTTILGVVGAFVATYLGQAVGWYHAGDGAGFIGGIVGAVILLFLYSLIMGRRSA